MKHTTLLVAIGIASLAASASAQQPGPKSTWLKPTSPRASAQHGSGAGTPTQPNPVPVTSTLVGGSDSCATPDVVVGAGPFLFDNTLASTGAEGQAEAGCLFYGSTAVTRDVWFTWTATFTGIARVTTCGIGNAVDTKIAVYNGAGCPTGAAIGCNDDGCATYESTVDAPVVNGQQYTIQIGTYPFPAPAGAAGGSGSFTITQLGAPPEDDCAAPILISGPGIFPFDNTAATTGAQGQAEAACNLFANTAILNDVWYTWTSTFTGNAQLSTCGIGNAIDTKVAVYNGAGCPVGPAIACNDDACPTFESTVDFPVVSGQQYTVQLGLYPNGGATPGAGQFSIQQFFNLPNDECTGATAIAGPGPHAYDTTNASTSPTGQTNARCYIFNTSTIAFDLWYVWTASSTGWVALNTCAGGTHDLRVAVYAGGGCPTGEPLSCDDDACGTVGASARAAFFATAGQQYLFQIGSYPAQPGAPGFFTVDPFTPAVGDDCASPIVVAGLGPIAWDNSFATTGFEGQNEALCSNEMITYDLWYRWTSTCTGPVTISECNQTSADTKLAVYAGSGCPAGAALACDDDGCGVGGGPSTITFNAVAGQNYMIQVGLWPGDVPNVGTFTIIPSCPPVLGTPFCFGDGSGTACPCGNAGAAGNGCANSLNAAGGHIGALGTASLAADSVVLQGSGMPNSSALYFQGTSQQNGGLGAVFGDGLRCAGGTVVRLKTVTNAAGASQYPGVGDQPVSVRGGVLVPGTRTYQIWYRNAAAYCTAATFNLTNGLQVDWLP